MAIDERDHDWVKASAMESEYPLGVAQVLMERNLSVVRGLVDVIVFVDVTVLSLPWYTTSSPLL